MKHNYHIYPTHLVSYKIPLQKIFQRPKNKNQDTSQEYANDWDCAMVTVESALALCSMLIFLFFACITLTAVIYQLKAIDISREVARLTAREQTNVSSMIDKPSSMQISVLNYGPFVQVEATIQIPIIHLHISAKSEALRETEA